MLNPCKRSDSAVEVLNKFLTALLLHVFGIQSRKLSMFVLFSATSAIIRCAFVCTKRETEASILTNCSLPLKNSGAKDGCKLCYFMLCVCRFLSSRPLCLPCGKSLMFVHAHI